MFYPSSIWIKPLVLPNFSQATLMHAQGKSKAGSEENKNISPRIQVAPILLRKALWVSSQKTTKCREGRATAVRPHVWQPCHLLFHQGELWAKQVIFSPLRIILSFVFCTKVEIYVLCYQVTTLGGLIYSIGVSRCRPKKWGWKNKKYSN